jgi:hypothetical protein
MTAPTLPAEIGQMTAQQLAELSPAGKLRIQSDLAAAAQWLKAAQERFDEALELAYGPACRRLLADAGRDFGTVQARDGDIVVQFEQPKRVKWDQAQLREIAERIVANGEQADHYIDAKLSIPEGRWKGWPPVLQQQFAKARSVEPGKPSITLRAEAC